VKAAKTLAATFKKSATPGGASPSSYA